MQDITEALQDYFDGVYESDADKLRAVFHPAAHVYCATDDALQDADLDAFVARVMGRESAAGRNLPRHDRVVSIDMSGPKSAVAKVELAIPPRYFTDHLSLAKLDGRWRIISKTYHYVDHG